MAIVRRLEIDIVQSDDVVRVRQAVREQAIAQGFSLVDQTKLVTAASELARNAIEHGGGGKAEVLSVAEELRRGVCLIVSDTGPGISDLELALKDGYTTRNGLGLGLSGARRLSNEFSIDSKPGEGTRVEIARWCSR